MTLLSLVRSLLPTLIVELWLSVANGIPTKKTIDIPAFTLAPMRLQTISY